MRELCTKLAKLDRANLAQEVDPSGVSDPVLQAHDGRNSDGWFRVNAGTVRRGKDASPRKSTIVADNVHHKAMLTKRRRAGDTEVVRLAEIRKGQQQRRR